MKTGYKIITKISRLNVPLLVSFARNHRQRH